MAWSPFRTLAVIVCINCLAMFLVFQNQLSASSETQSQMSQESSRELLRTEFGGARDVLRGPSGLDSRSLLRPEALLPVPSSPAPSLPAANPQVYLIGMASALDFHGVHVFIQSARIAMPHAHIVIFADEIPPPYRELYDAFDVDARVYSLSSLPPHTRSYHPSLFRWLLIRDYMQSLSSNSSATVGSLVMFSDARDVMFQSDPFQRMTRHMADNGLDTSQHAFYAFAEAEPTKIRQCGWNKGWIQDCFGNEVLTQLGKNIISCSGTSMSTWESGLAYVTMMAHEIESMHNVFVHRHDLENTQLITNERGWIASVQSMKVLPRDAFGRLLNADGEPYSVVHQWDRSEALKSQYAAQFFTVDPQHRRRK